MTPHLHLQKSDRHSRVIVCGSPERAKWFSTLLETSTCVSQNREYHSYLGKLGQADILIVSHGIGASGATICFQELVDAGATSIVRVGTAGGFYEGAKIGDIVIATGAVREEGTSNRMIHASFPAVPDFSLTRQLVDASANGVARKGIVLSSDVYYPGVLPLDYQLYKDCGVLAVEMECSALFITAQLRKVRAAAVVVLDGMPLSTEADNFDPRPERLAASLATAFHSATAALTRAKQS